MDNHPIPQDVTGFQFKLIGNMTVKQFAYLLGGSISAWIFFSIGISPFLKLPIALFCVLSGVSLAFLPIEGRPMDTMMLRFIKALFTPNQFVYQKQGGQLAILLTPARVSTHKVQILAPPKDIQSYIAKLPKKPKKPPTGETGKLDEKEMGFFTSLTNYFQATAPAPASLSSNQAPHLISMETPAPSAEPAKDLPNEELLEKETAVLKEELEQAKKPAHHQLSPQVTAGGEETAHHRVADLEKQLAEIMSQKQQLEQQLVALNRQVFTPTTATIPQQTPNVRKIPTGMGAKVGLPISVENPNLIVGIVKDPRGNVLPNILVEVKDKEGNPVRAFKTNNLGQFASATPLLNGVYTLEFEDPLEKNKFDTIEITANGQVLPPLEILSTDQREQLRKELFGTT